MSAPAAGTHAGDDPDAEPPGPPRVTLAKGRARPLWAGHSNVYEGAIEGVEGVPVDGGDVDVLDHRGRFVGRGVWNGRSVVRVCVLRSTRGDLDAAFVLRRVRRAVELRRDVLRLPAVSDAWRVVHGDGDRLPGVVADRYGDWVVLQVTGRAMADRRGALAAALLVATGARGVWERAAPRFAERDGFHAGGGRLAGETPPETIDIAEHGVRFRIDVVRGQKTGHFLDQRDNRRAFGALCEGRRVLDAFCGSGGFGLAALAAGAASVVALDQSQRALARTTVNAEMNGVHAYIETREGDGFAALAALHEAGERFAAVSLDPPRFASSRREVPAALRGYSELNARALSLVERGGLLATSSCTGAVSEHDFLVMLRDAAVRARRRVQVLRVTGAAPDHPWLTAVPEGRYLKHVLVRVL